MRGVRKTKEVAVETEEEIIDKPQRSKKTVANPYIYKSEFKRFTGTDSEEWKELKSPDLDSKGKAKSESFRNTVSRSLFFGHYINGKYKILMVYKGKGNTKKHAKFDVFSNKNRLKYNFFKSKGIIF